MFDAVLDVKLGYVICGIIWSIAMGFAVGNYACSLVHRLPRGRLILDKPPYCGHCGTLLGTKDLFPVFSALWLRHKCRYCKVPFPVSHTWTELLVGLLFMLAYLKYGFTERFVLVISLGVFLIVLAAIHANEAIIMGKVVLGVAIFGMMFRILQDHSIYGFFQGGLFALIAGVLLWNKHIKKVGHIYSFPKPLELFTVGGLVVGTTQLVQYFILYAAFFLIGLLIGKLRNRPLPYTAAFGLAVTLSALYPAAINF